MIYKKEQRILLRYVMCLDTGVSYGFIATTPYEAMRKMIYTLNISNEKRDAIINKTVSGEHLYIEHGGKTYAIRNL